MNGHNVAYIKWATSILRVAALALPALLGPSLAEAKTQLWIEGDSTLHAYASTATAVTVEFGWKGTPPADLEAGLKAGAPAAFTLKVPVSALKSDHKGLDKNLRKTLKAEEHPDIVFVMAEYRQAEGGSPRRLIGKGDLSVAGVTKPIEVAGTLAVENGQAVLSGQHELLMTDFGLKPPKMMLGAIKTDNRVVVKFRIELPKEGK